MELEEALMTLMIQEKDTQRKPRLSQKQKWRISFRKPSLSFGHTFKRACIQAWGEALDFIPTLPHSSTPDLYTVIPSLALKSTIINWCRKHSINPPKRLDSAVAEDIVPSLIVRQKSSVHSKKGIPNSKQELIQGVYNDSLSLRLNHAVIELIGLSIHFDCSSKESFIMSTALQLSTRPSCYSTPSASEIESLNPKSSSREEEEFVSRLRSQQVFDIEDFGFVEEDDEN